MITAGTTVSAFGCCLACTVGAARMIYAMSRDSFGERGVGAAHGRWGTPAAATGVVTVMAVIIYVVYVVVSSSPSAVAENAFLWSGTIGTLILLVVYVLATIGMTLLVFVRRKMPSVPMWQVIIPIAGDRRARLHDLPERVPVPDAATATGSPSWRAPGCRGGHRGAARAAHGATARRRADVPRGHLPVARPCRASGQIRVAGLHGSHLLTAETVISPQQECPDRKLALFFCDGRLPVR